jgi:ABC-type Mn2+/Zn2+ transport system ATPase subunit
VDILRGISLAVQTGEIVSTIGPNGTGKSTAFKTIVGFLTPSAGRVTFEARTSPASAPTSSCGGASPTCRGGAPSFPT